MQVDPRALNKPARLSWAGRLGSIESFSAATIHRAFA
jgi:hypothetical protein